MGSVSDVADRCVQVRCGCCLARIADELDSIFLESGLVPHARPGRTGAPPCHAIWLNGRFLMGLRFP
jgi:hypothetical protein